MKSEVIEKLNELQEIFDALPTGFLESLKNYDAIFLGCSEKSMTKSGKSKVDLTFKVDNCVELSQMYLLDNARGQQEFKDICVNFFNDTEEPKPLEDRIKNANTHIGEKYIVKFLSKGDFRKFRVEEKIC